MDHPRSGDEHRALVDLVADLGLEGAHTDRGWLVYSIGPRTWRVPITDAVRAWGAEFVQGYVRRGEQTIALALWHREARPLPEVRS